MKFKSTSPQRRTLVPAITPTKTPKHKPVVKEPKYSPTPAKNVTPVKCVGSGSPARFKRGSSSCSTSSNSGSTEKCREIRDLHNSMERQRRVDLRLNFEQVYSSHMFIIDRKSRVENMAWNERTSTKTLRRFIHVIQI
jgi:hypothetical protein